MSCPTPIHGPARVVSVGALLSRTIGDKCFPEVTIVADVTQVLSQIESGDPSAAERLLPLVYEELRKLAAARLANEKPGQTLQATALVHEAYVRLVDVEKAQHWNSRGHFFAAAAEAMRRILIDNARRKRRPRHGGTYKRVSLDEVCSLADGRSADLLDLDDALTKLADIAPVKADLVKLRFFVGMTIPEAADVLGISHATAERHWTYARVWLYCELGGDAGDLRKNS
jgi:RNA polymerase sigma factor (TIGR02999 family)